MGFVSKFSNLAAQELVIPMGKNKGLRIEERAFARQDGY